MTLRQDLSPMSQASAGCLTSRKEAEARRGSTLPQDASQNMAPSQPGSRCLQMYGDLSVPNPRGRQGRQECGDLAETRGLCQEECWGRASPSGTLPAGTHAVTTPSTAMGSALTPKANAPLFHLPEADFAETQSRPRKQVRKPLCFIVPCGVWGCFTTDR